MSPLNVHPATKEYFTAFEEDTIFGGSFDAFSELWLESGLINQMFDDVHADQHKGYLLKSVLHTEESISQAPHTTQLVLAIPNWPSYPYYKKLLQMQQNKWATLISTFDKGTYSFLSARRNTQGRTAASKYCVAQWAVDIWLVHRPESSAIPNLAALRSQLTEWEHNNLKTNIHPLESVKGEFEFSTKHCNFCYGRTWQISKAYLHCEECDIFIPLGGRCTDIERRDKYKTWDTLFPHLLKPTKYGLVERYYTDGGLVEPRDNIIYLPTWGVWNDTTQTGHSGIFTEGETVMGAELFAILQAITLNADTKPMVIYTDCLGAVRLVETYHTMSIKDKQMCVEVNTTHKIIQNVQRRQHAILIG